MDNAYFSIFRTKIFNIIGSTRLVKTTYPQNIVFDRRDIWNCVQVCKIIREVTNRLEIVHLHIEAQNLLYIYSYTYT